MNIEEFRNYCLSFPATSEGLPFDENTLVFKVGPKMFALTSLAADPLRVNLKCDPEEALQLREKYVCVRPGYHMNKKHWNTVIIDASVDDALLRKWITNSYNLVFHSLPKKQQNEIRST